MERDYSPTPQTLTLFHLSQHQQQDVPLVNPIHVARQGLKHSETIMENCIHTAQATIVNLKKLRSSVRKEYFEAQLRQQRALEGQPVLCHDCSGAATNKATHKRNGNVVKPKLNCLRCTPDGPPISTSIPSADSSQTFLVNAQICRKNAEAITIGLAQAKCTWALIPSNPSLNLCFPAKSSNSSYPKYDTFERFYSDTKKNDTRQAPQTKAGSAFTTNCLKIAERNTKDSKKRLDDIRCAIEEWEYNVRRCKAELLALKKARRELDWHEKNLLQQRLAAMGELDLSQQVCHICSERPKDLTFQCGHRFCRQCSDQVRKCPTCRAPIQQRIQLYD